VSSVKLVFFTQKNACQTCQAQLELLRELSSLSDKIELETYDLVEDGEQIRRFGIERIPATAVIGKKDYGIRFYGVTAGYEFQSLLQAILMVSAGSSGLDPKLEALVKAIKEPVHLKVFVTLTCPYCPQMVHVAHQFALVNENIRADVVDVSEFPELAQKYEVSGVPKTIVNEIYHFEGALPAERVYLEILKAVNPEQYRLLEESIREYEGVRKAKRVDDQHRYEVIIVGGGPAAMSAAIYTARKGLDVALIAKKLGGQITYTATIENYLGISNISGMDMTEAFRNHVENYPIAEAIGTSITMVKKEGDVFTVTTEDNRQFRCLSVIYCAGKEYRRLGVPGEERFIGKSIGFCATCDAPLYRGRRVAVVGGGNSAFTATRDLLSFAVEIHLIHRRDEFTADETLVKEVLSAKRVKVHRPMIVSSFLGKEKLTGVRLESVDGKERYDLSVDGVFLEIGLTPNTDPVKGLVELNERGEISVLRDQSTSVEGFFAAGDVTDVEEKQISIAVGQGALAALTAHRYLFEKHLTKSKVGFKESWQ